MMRRIKRLAGTACLVAVWIPALVQAQSRDIPVIDEISSDFHVDVQESISFDVRASSEEQEIPWLWADSLPRGAALNDSGNGYRIFSWTPEIEQAGLYSIRLIAADALDQSRQRDHRITLVVSGEIDRTLTPSLELPDSVSVLAGETVSFRVEASRPLGVVPALMTENLPQGADFTDNGDTSRQFTWQTDDVDLGTHQIAFRAVDPNTLRSSIANVSVRITSPSLAILDVSALSETDGFTIMGSLNESDSLGRSVSQAGDINGDGLGDIIVGAPGAYQSTDRLDLISGAAYVVFGSIDGFGSEFDVASVDGSNGFEIVGSDMQLGEEVSNAGDLNGDGIDDVLIGAPYATLDDGIGRVYVLFGKLTEEVGNFSAQVQLQDLDGSDGFVLEGLGENDLLGISLDAVGDVNGDGIDDVVLGSPENFFGREGPGQAYVVYGRTDGFPARWSVEDLDGSNGFQVIGVNDGERMGSGVSGAGDVNADGINDIMIARGSTNLDGTEGTGLRAFVLFGRDTGTSGGFPAKVYVSELDGYNGFSIDSANVYGDQASGMRLDGDFDFNADGLSDLIFAEDGYHSGESRYAGQLYVVYGRDTAESEAFPYKVDASLLRGDSGRRIRGIESHMHLGISVSALKDVNGDGIGDLLAKSSGNQRAYVLYGRDDSSDSGMSEFVTDIDQAEGFVLINVPDTNSRVSSQRASDAGDINGDGFSDLLLGSPEDAADDRAGGKVFVIYGADQPRD